MEEKYLLKNVILYQIRIKNSFFFLVISNDLRCHKWKAFLNDIFLYLMRNKHFMLNLPLNPINKCIKFGIRTRHAGHCWRSRDELIRDVLLWTPTHGRAKAGRPARTYIQQLCEDTGCCPEDLPRAMNDREEWRERVRDIRATSAT